MNRAGIAGVAILIGAAVVVGIIGYYFLPKTIESCGSVLPIQCERYTCVRGFPYRPAPVGSSLVKCLWGNDPILESSSVINQQTSTSDTCKDTDGGRNIYAKGEAITTDQNGVTLHITSDSCATKLAGNYPSGEPRYLEGLSSCSGGNCYLLEGVCKEYEGSLLDGREFIQCPNGCNGGACVPQP